jgi:hypothetical protein
MMLCRCRYIGGRPGEVKVRERSADGLVGEGCIGRSLACVDRPSLVGLP